MKVIEALGATIKIEKEKIIIEGRKYVIDYLLENKNKEDYNKYTILKKYLLLI